MVQFCRRVSQCFPPLATAGFTLFFELQPILFVLEPPFFFDARHHHSSLALDLNTPVSPRQLRSKSKIPERLHDIPFCTYPSTHAHPKHDSRLPAASRRRAINIHRPLETGAASGSGAQAQPQPQRAATKMSKLDMPTFSGPLEPAAINSWLGRRLKPLA